MKQHERDYFVSRIRSGSYHLRHGDLRLKVYTPTMEEEFEANEIFIESYTECLNDGIKTFEVMVEWMGEIGLWTEKDIEKEEGLKKDIERLKIEIFNHRNQEAMREKIRKYLRAGEDQLTQHSNKKYKYYDNSCEGISWFKKSLFLINRCTFVGSERYDFSDVGERQVWMTYQSLMSPEKNIREFARTDPWRTAWILRENMTSPLFGNKDRELSIDQKNLLSWSSMYDSIAESPECPADDVIKDDDMLDGWLALQTKKREAEKTKSELESNMNDKVRNSDEIFMMAGSHRDAERIDSMNNIAGKMIKKERKAHIKKRGRMEQHELPDQKIQIQNQLTQQYKDKFRR